MQLIFYMLMLADCGSTLERICYVAAFASSVYANVPGRFVETF